MPEEGQHYEDPDSPTKKARPEDELDLTSVQLVNALISEKKAKNKQQGALGKPLCLHSQLRLHELEPIPTTARELLRSDKAAQVSVEKTVEGKGGKKTPPVEAGAARKAGMLAPKQK